MPCAHATAAFRAERQPPSLHSLGEPLAPSGAIGEWSASAAAGLMPYSRAMNALFIACSDGRVAAVVRALQEKEGLLEADLFLVPGGPLVLTRPGMERRVALDCVRTQLEVHGTRTIYLVSHQDCAAYERALGGLGFDQQELLERDLRRVRTLLENTFSDVEVHCFIVPWRENGDGPGFGEAEPVE